MNELDPELQRVIAAARLAEARPIPPVPFGLATRVLAEARQRGAEVISNRLLGAIFVGSATLALVWALVFLGSEPVGSDQTFNEIATRMVTRVGR
jgi:hypothetical protein